MAVIGEFQNLISLAPAPEIKIGGVSITQQSFTWSFSAGPYPYQTTISVPRAVSSQLAIVQNPTTIEVSVANSTSKQWLPKLITIENVYLVSPADSNRIQVTWTIADSRWGWRGRKIFAAFNKTIVKNAKGIGINPNERNPAIIRKFWDRFSLGRYIEWSVKEDGTPYNVLEMLKIVLDQLGIPHRFAPETDKYAYIVENVEYEGTDIYNGLAELLSKSRLNMTVDRSGTAIIYSLDFYDNHTSTLLNKIAQSPPTSSSRIYKSDYRRIRPKHINIMFRKLHEVRVIANKLYGDYDESKRIPVMSSPIVTQDDIDNWRAISCENVIQAPVPLWFELENRYFQIGEYVPMWKFTSALGISEHDIRTLWFSGQLYTYIAYRLTQDSGGQHILSNYTLASQLESAIKSSYRQLYMIDPWLVRRMRKWDTRRVSIVDNYTKFSPPSPLWADYCIVPKIRIPAVARRQASWNHYAQNWIVDNEDPNREKPTAGTINMVHQKLGIFRVSYPSDPLGAVADIIPSSVENLPEAGIASMSHPFWRQANLAEDHTLECLISVVWNTDTYSDYSGSKKYYMFSFSDSQADGPDIYYLSNLEYARFPATRSDKEQTLPDLPQNHLIIMSLASAEQAKLYNQYQDRYIGVCRLAGDIDIIPNGNIKSVSLVLDPGRGLETVIDARSIPPDYTMEQVVPQKVLNYMKSNLLDTQEGKLSAF